MKRSEPSAPVALDPDTSALHMGGEAGNPWRDHRSARSSRRARDIVARLWPPALFAVIALGLWQIGAMASGITTAVLPTPTAVLQALWTDRGLLKDSAWVTVQEILVGYALALALGIGLGALLRSARIVERAIYPWLVASQMVPTVAIAPIFVIWTGFDIRPKVMVIALVSFFPLVVNTVDGLRAVEPDLVQLLRSMGASRWRIFRSAQVPAALPFIFSGMKVAAAFSVIGAVFGEWVGASSGLGYLILTFNNQTATAEVFAVVTVLSALGIGLFLLVGLLERALLPWYYLGRRESGDLERVWEDGP